MPRMDLDINHGTREGSTPGSFVYAGQSIKRLHMIFVAKREYRILYQSDYDDDPKAPMVCASWNGVQAYGRGGRDLSQPIKERICTQMRGGRSVKVCQSAMGAGDMWICRPRQKFFVMILWSEAKQWMPAIWNVGGKSIRNAEDAYSKATMRSIQAGTTPEGLPVLPVWHLATEVALVRSDPNKIGYVPVFDTFQKLQEDSAQQINSFLKEYGGHMWTAELERMEAVARSVGQDVPAEEAETVKKVDVQVHKEKSGEFDNIPF